MIYQLRAKASCRVTFPPFRLPRASPLFVLLLELLLITGAGCTRQPALTILPTQRITISRLISNPATSDSECSVRILRTPPARSYRVLGTISARGSALASGEIARMLEQTACHMGADALIAPNLPKSDGTESTYDVRAQAIVFGPAQRGRRSGPAGKKPLVKPAANELPSSGPDPSSTIVSTASGADNSH
jgi:hypothetical protein